MTLNVKKTQTYGPIICEKLVIHTTKNELLSIITNTEGQEAVKGVIRIITFNPKLVDAVNDHKQTSLHYAAKLGKQNLLELLLKVSKEKVH